MVSPHAARSRRTTFSTSNGGARFPLRETGAAVSSVDRPEKKSLAELSSSFPSGTGGGIISYSAEREEGNSYEVSHVDHFAESVWKL